MVTLDALRHFDANERRSRAGLNCPLARPVQVGLSGFRQEAGSSYHLLMAAATFVVAPIVVLFLVAQRYLVQGIARTGIRG